MKRLILGAAMLAIFAVSLSLTSHGATAQVPPASTSTSTPSPTATRTPTATPTPSPTPSPTVVPAAAAAAVGPAAAVVPAAAEDAGPALFTCYSAGLDETQEAEEEAVNEEAEANEDARTLLIVTEQGSEHITVGGLELLCVSSAKAGEDSEAEAPAAEDTRVLVCYSIDDGNDPRDGYSFTTESYGSDAVVIRESELVCEEASMTLEDDTTVGAATGVAWLCQRIRGGDDAAVDIDYANIFGTDSAEVDNAVGLCALASELGDPSDEPVVEPLVPAADVVEAETEEVVEPITLLACFDLDKAGEAEVTVTIETLTFGSLDVFVGNASMWCESATETPQNATANSAGDENEEDDDGAQPPIVTSAGANGLDANGDDVDAEIARLIEQLRDDPTDETIDRLMDIILDHDDEDFGESETETVE